jgi:hypothetical protein
MQEEILLDDKPYTFTIDNLPCLIHYEQGTGGSHLSIALFAQLYRQGYKLVFICAYPQGEEKLVQMLGGYENIAFVNAREDFPGADAKQVVLLDNGNDSLLFDAEQMLPDYEDRIVFVKNIETFPERLIKMLLSHHNIILSGDLDESTASAFILKQHFSSLILFSKPRLPVRIRVPELETWSAYLNSPTKSGIIKIKK